MENPKKCGLARVCRGTQSRLRTLSTPAPPCRAAVPCSRAAVPPCLFPSASHYHDAHRLNRSCQLLISIYSLPFPHPPQKKNRTKTKNRYLHFTHLENFKHRILAGWRSPGCGHVWITPQGITNNSRPLRIHSVDPLPVWCLPRKPIFGPRPITGLIYSP